MWRINIILFLLATAILPSRQVAAQDVHKAVIFSVVDASTGKPVEGAEISFKMLLGKITKKTGSDGKASFDLYLAGVSTANYSYTIATAGKTHKTYTGTLTLVSSKDVYELSASLQSLSRKVSLSLADANQKQLSNTEVRLKDMATDLELVSRTDANGIANFELPAGASSGNFLLRINKQGFTELALPVAIDEQTSRLAVVVPIEAKPLVADLDIPAPVPLPVPAPAFSASWGPYRVDCEANVFADIPPFSHRFIEKEKGMLEVLASSCLEPVTKALDSVLSFMDGLEALQAKIQSLQKQAELQKANPKTASMVQLQQEHDLRLFEQVNNARRQLKDMVEKMNSFAEGPMTYMRDCLWDVVKDKTLPEDINKVLKTPEYFEKATKTVKEMYKDFSTTNYPKLTLLKYGLMDEFRNILSNIDKTITGLNLLMSIVKEPSQLYPYKLQVSMAIEAAEKGMSSVMTDCQVRECHQQIKKGIVAAKAALTSYNRAIAQNALCRSQEGESIDEDLRLNNRKEAMGWRKTQDPEVIKYLPPYAYSEYVKCNNAVFYAQQDSIEMNKQLKKLAQLCRKIQPIAAVLNERVNKYEGLYNSGLLAVEKCNLGEAALYVNQLVALENSECGQFFPRPYGITKSEELKNQIAKVKESGFCDKEKKVVTNKGEQKFGPFEVPSGQWLPTGITLRKGDMIRVQSDGYLTTKTGSHIGPEGGGVWMWWTLAGEIGSQRLYLGKDKGGEITGGGELKLGTPRGLGSTIFLKEDVENLQGYLKVFVFVKRGW